MPTEGVATAPGHRWRILSVGLLGFASGLPLALTNPTISASVMIAGMLVFSGLGALLSEKLFDRARATLPMILLAVAALLTRKDADVSRDELDRLSRLIEKAKREGR